MVANKNKNMVTANKYLGIVLETASQTTERRRAYLYVDPRRLR